MPSESMLPPRSTRPRDNAELADLVRGADPAEPLVVRGGGTKPALSGRSRVVTSTGGTSRGGTFRDDPFTVDLRDLTGILAYEPSEFTISVRAGTPLSEIRAALAEHGQALPFDPPFIDAGSTAGGAVATGLSGPARLSGGGVRDTVLAVRFIDGKARHARAGAPVVKNAAGFDLPKLLVGSLGSLAILTEITFKVLPAPSAYLTGQLSFGGFEKAHTAALALLGQPFRLEGLELLPKQDTWVLAIRVGGEASSLRKRLQRIKQFLIDHGLDDEKKSRGIEEPIKEPVTEKVFWRQRRDMEWAPKDAPLIWIPTAATGTLALHRELEALDAFRARHQRGTAFVGGLSAAWISWSPEPGEKSEGILDKLDETLKGLGLAGLMIRAPNDAQRPPIIGELPGRSVHSRVKAALDPAGRLISLG